VINNSYLYFFDWELSGAGNIMVSYLVLVIEAFTIYWRIINELPNA